MERNKISKHKRSAEIGRRLLSGVALLGLSGVVLVGLSGVTAIGCTSEGDERSDVGQQAMAATAPGFTGPDPVQITFTLEGCKLGNDDGTYDVPTTLICADAAYTTGNLGKDWNELDLVPHRLTADAAGAPDNTTLGGQPAQKYQVNVGGDHQDGIPFGYDFLTEPVLNVANSTQNVVGDCQVTVITQNAIGNFGFGGGDLQIVNVLEITQTIDSVCAFDYVEQLAVTSSQIAGSSLRSFIASGTGEKSVPLPSDIQPQVLAKTMTAVEDSLIKWLIEKTANPVDFDFGNTCNDDVPNTKDVVVGITFTKGDTEFSDLTATTMAKATNPSQRDVTYDCTDEVYGVLQGAGSESLVDTETFEGVVQPGMETINVEHILEPNTRDLRDELECKLFVESLLIPGTFIEVGTLTAEFSLPNDQIGEGDVVNEQVVVEDTESITGTGYTFSAVQSGGVTGSFLGYTPGNSTTGPVNWASDPQGDTGTVQFTKTVTVERAIDSDGTLEDTASIDLTGTIDVEATASTTFTTDPKIDLVINKELGFTVANATTWTFDVEGSQGNPVADDVTITIPGGSSSGSVTVSDLDPDTYTVTETAVNGWVPTANPQMVTLALPRCERSVTFTNNPGDNFFAQVEVQKMTDPTGNEAGWDFNLTGTAGGESASVTTTDANFIRFHLDGGTNPGADADSYSMAEVPQAGWDLQADIVYSVVNCWDVDQNVKPTVVQTCDFDVQYERDVGCVFRCTYKNIQRGKIIVEKQTDPADSPQLFEFIGEEAAGFIADNGQIMVDNLVPGTYTSTEIVPATWDLTSIVCEVCDEMGENCVEDTSTSVSSGDIGTAKATFGVDPGETTKCTFTNVERGMADVLKTVSGGLPNGETFDFELRTGADASSTGTVAASCTTDPVTGACMFTCAAVDPPCRDVNGAAKLVPGDYQFCEANVMPGWMSSVRDFANAFPLPINGNFFVPNQNDPLVDNSVYCAPFELVAGATESFAVDNTPPPGGDARTIGFWKNWTSCDGKGQQDPVLDEALANSMITCPDSGEPGIWIGKVCVDTCYEAVSLLDKREISEDLRGKKRASDACYNAASQLLASELNELAGARTCTDLRDLQSDTQAILYTKKFDGEGKCVRGGPTGQVLNDLAFELDAYNNNDEDAVCMEPQVVCPCWNGDPDSAGLGLADVWQNYLAPPECTQQDRCSNDPSKIGISNTLEISRANCTDLGFVTRVTLVEQRENAFGDILKFCQVLDFSGTVPPVSDSSLSDQEYVDCLAEHRAFIGSADSTYDNTACGLPTP